LDLPQFNWWKRRFYPNNHISKVSFEFGSFNKLRSRVLRQNPRREKREIVWVTEKSEKISWMGSLVFKNAACSDTKMVRPNMCVWNRRYEFSVRPVWIRVNARTYWKSRLQARPDTASDIGFLPSPSKHQNGSVRTCTENQSHWLTRPDT
jgi:hypothetical protein